MSAVRHERRGSRAMQTSPYARPAKKSSWSLSNLFSFLNPLRSRDASEELEPEKSPEWMSLSSNLTEAEDIGKSAELQAVDYQHDATIQMDPDHPARLGPPHDRTYQPATTTSSLPKQSTLQLDDIDDSSPAKNLEIVTKFLEERGGKPMSSVELEGVISLIRKSAPAEKPQPFRFSSSLSPTPGRDESPDTMSEFNPTSNGTTQVTRRMLTKNPNGVYRWRGGGSARPARSRNRYASPTFGPPRVISDRLVLKESTTTGEGQRTDTKRRRIGEESLSTFAGVPSKAPTDSSTPVQITFSDSVTTKTTQPVSSVVSPAASPRPINGTSTQLKANPPNGTPAFRIRPHGLQKPTTPAVPSPLRQAWSGASSDGSSSPAQTSPKPTKAANLMAELIKEVTPPKRPDVSNPYQTASPVKVIPSTTRPRPKRPRPTVKPAATSTMKGTAESGSKGDEEVGTEKLSPQAIIEATLPKGSKRARPPAHFEKPITAEPIIISPLEPAMDGTSETCTLTTQPPVKGTHTDVAYTVEEAGEDEDAIRVAKKPKPYLNGRGVAPVDRRTTVNEAVVEEIKDVEMCNTNERLMPKAIPLSIGPTAAPSKPMSGSKPTSIPKEPSKLRFSYQPETAAPTSSTTTSSDMVVDEANTGESSTKQLAVTSTKDPKATALALPASALPTFTFTFSAISRVTISPTEEMARGKAISKAEASLPTFPFATKPEIGLSTSNIAATAPIKAFDWAAAGCKPPPTATSGDWTCSTCGLLNPASATEKCTICEEPR